MAHPTVMVRALPINRIYGLLEGAAQGGGHIEVAAGERLLYLLQHIQVSVILFIIAERHPVQRRGPGVMAGGIVERTV